MHPHRVIIVLSFDRNQSLPGKQRLTVPVGSRLATPAMETAIETPHDLRSQGNRRGAKIDAHPENR